MIFSEPRFLLFFLLVFGVYWALPTNQLRKWFLLARQPVLLWQLGPRFLVADRALRDGRLRRRLEDRGGSRAGRSARRWLFVEPWSTTSARSASSSTSTSSPGRS
jgi:hypothetical protein